MTPGLLTTRKNQALLVLTLLERSLSRLTLHLQRSRKILKVIGGEKGGAKRGEGTEKKSGGVKSTMREKRGSETSMRVDTTRRTGRSATARISRRGGMILINVAG